MQMQGEAAAVGVGHKIGEVEFTGGISGQGGMKWLGNNGTNARSDGGRARWSGWAAMVPVREAVGPL